MVISLVFALIGFSGLAYAGLTGPGDTATAADDTCAYCRGNSYSQGGWNSAHPIAREITAVGALYGRSVSVPPNGEIVAQAGAQVFGATVQVDAGRVFMFHDEWVTYTSQWDGSSLENDCRTIDDPNHSCLGVHPTTTYQVPQFWYNALRWVSGDPECFDIEQTLRAALDIPVFHDDQHGTAIISAAGLLNALELTGKRIDEIRICVSGAGAAAISCSELMVRLGVLREHILMVDSRGVIYRGRTEAMNKYNGLNVEAARDAAAPARATTPQSSAALGGGPAAGCESSGTGRDASQFEIALTSAGSSALTTSTMQSSSPARRCPSRHAPIWALM